MILRKELCMSLTPEQKTRVIQALLVFILAVAAAFGIDISGIVGLGLTP